MRGGRGGGDADRAAGRARRIAEGVREEYERHMARAGAAGALERLVAEATGHFIAHGMAEAVAEAEVRRWMGGSEDPATLGCLLVAVQRFVAAEGVGTAVMDEVLRGHLRRGEASGEARRAGA